MKRPIGIRLDGCIYATGGKDLSEEEFSNAFTKFIEEVMCLKGPK
ncbi:hypothetical protein [Sporosarcina ureae]|nr:hypothetical protein [Sporosarcina ureae]